MISLSDSLEDYLEAVYLIGSKNKVVRVKEIASFLNVKMPSVVDAISKLQERELIVHEKYGYLNLTKSGADAAKLIYKKHKEIYKFLSQFLGMDNHISEKDACGMEHHISKNTLDRIIKLMEFLESNPASYPEWLERFNHFVKSGKNITKVNETKVNV
ncbi:MAG: metal-dependent transcriptional regulator [Actinobacteria bacterium]|nr:metal-dependent transcriptional regulator [Actinomycetota bacterium]